MQDKRTLKRKHLGLHINPKHMQHVVQGLLHERGLAHKLTNHKPQRIHFLLGRRHRGRLIMPPTSRFDF